MTSILHSFYTQRDRVRKAGPDTVNETIDAQIMESLHVLSRGPKEKISERLQALDYEWSFDRLMGAQAAVVGLSGLWLSATDKRAWLGMTTFSLVMLLLYALIGWCPPVETLRKFNIRTEQEINLERYALKALRGDFANIQKLKSSKRAKAAYEAAVLEQFD